MRHLPFCFMLSFLFAQFQDKIVLKTHSGDTISVSNGIIYYNSKPLSETIEGVVYSSKYSRLIEKDSSLLLFLEIDDSPNFNELIAFRVDSQKAIKLVKCAYNDKSQGIGPPPFTDMDNDGNVEFGGFDLTESYASKDSMYYNPSQYYEVNNGTIIFDSSLTKQMDIKINGIYLQKVLNDDGNCCLIIKKPTKNDGNQ